jgi:hypothetical protein
MQACSGSATKSAKKLKATTPLKNFKRPLKNFAGTLKAIFYKKKFRGKGFFFQILKLILRPL